MAAPLGDDGETVAELLGDRRLVIGGVGGEDVGGAELAGERQARRVALEADREDPVGLELAAAAASWTAIRPIGPGPTTATSSPDLIEIVSTRL
jgi:hypothetical protein